MANLDKKEIKEINNLLEKIKKNQYFDLRNSEFYEPWDTSDETKGEIADACYYLLTDCIDLLKELIDE